MACHLFGDKSLSDTMLTYSKLALCLYQYFDGLVQERRNSIVLAMELNLSYTYPPIRPSNKI